MRTLAIAASVAAGLVGLASAAVANFNSAERTPRSRTVASSLRDDLSNEISTALQKVRL